MTRRSPEPAGEGRGFSKPSPFERWGRVVASHPVLFVVVIVVVTAILVAQTRHLRLAIHEEDQLPQGHPYVQLYNRINDMFGGGSVIVVGLRARAGTIFDPRILSKVVRITRDLGALREVRAGRIMSLATAEEPRSHGDQIEVVSIMPTAPTTAGELRTLSERVAAQSMLKGLLVSSDASATAIVIDLPVEFATSETVHEIAAIADAEADASAEVLIGGGPIVVDAMEQYTAQMGILFPIAVLVIGIVHYEAFRTVQAFILPLTTALISVAWALGIMGLLRYPLDTWSAVTPIAVLAVAAGHAVQILKRYYEELRTAADNRTAVVRSIARTGPVMFAATAIASGGFASLATFDIASVRAFGLLMACGILSTFVVEMTFIPACRALIATPPPREHARDGGAWADRLLTRLAAIVGRRPGGALLVTVALLLVVAPGATWLRVDNSLGSLFPADSRVRHDERMINEAFAGTSTVRLLVEGDEPGALTDPRVLQAIVELQRFLEAQPGVGATLSIADFVKQVADVVDPATSARGLGAMTRRLVAQLLLVRSLSSSSDTSGFADAEYRNGSIVAYCRTDEAAFAGHLFAAIERFASTAFDGLPARIRVGGGSLGAQAAMNEVVVDEKTRNTIQVATIVFLLSSVALRSVLGGALVLVPLVVAGMLTVAFMGWTGIWLSMSTATVLAMGISIGADFAIYLLFRVAEELGHHDLNASVREAIVTSGKAVIFVSSAITLGYLVLVTSGFAPWMYLGGLMALIVSLGAVSSLVLVPAIMLLVRPAFIEKMAGRMIDR